MGDMEVYSTLLWHLQRNVKLSFLAQELLSIDPRAPQAWIAVGNCFSLQKERVQALTCFHRASQLDPTCAYAYTLSGHESIDDDLDKAVTFFQSALRADPRHYNAWCVFFCYPVLPPTSLRRQFSIATSRVVCLCLFFVLISGSVRLITFIDTGTGWGHAICG